MADFDIQVEMADSDSDGEEGRNPLIHIDPRILQELAHLNLSEYVDFKRSRVIGGGSYGDVTLARCRIPDRGKVKVAIKRLRFYLPEDMKLLFEKEIYVWSKLNHTNILPLLGFAIDVPPVRYPLLISEWMENGSAWTYVKKHPDCDMMKLITGIAEGLNYLHEFGVVHSDIKSDNVVISITGDARICDFGCSRMIEASRSIANLSSDIRGTSRYLAYELLVPPRSRKQRFSGHTAESDVWALGMTIYELYFRTRPFEGLNDFQAISAIVRRQLPRFPSQMNIESGFLKNICLTCWNRDPTHRPSMGTVLGDIKGVTRRAEGPTIYGHPIVPNLGDAFLDDINPDRLTPDLKKEGPDWFAIFNPKVKRVLDVNLMNTLNHESVVCSVRFSADGKYLATGCNRTTQIYDTKTGQKICVLNDESASPVGDLYIRDVCFSPDGKLLATGAEDKTIRVWEIAKKRIKRVLEGHQQEIYSVEFSKNGRLLVSGSGDRTARIWDMVTGMQQVLEINEPDGVDAGVTSVAISPDDRHIATGSLDTIVRIWEVQTGNLVGRLKGHRDSVYSVAFTVDGKGIVSGSLDKTSKYWDISAIVNGSSIEVNGGGAERGNVNTLNYIGHKDYVICVAVSHDDQWFISGSKDRSVRFWAAKTGQEQLMLQGHANSVIQVDHSPTGGMFATGSGDMQAKLWSYTEM